MTQIKHTPGPWAHINPDGFTVRHPQVYSDTGPVCNATWLGDVRIDELRANARLISAAPELLEALQEAAPCGWMENSKPKCALQSPKPQEPKC